MPSLRLKSQIPGWPDYTSTYRTIKGRRKAKWNKNRQQNYELVEEPDLILRGFHILKREWWRLNRFQCDEGRSNYLMINSELCEIDEVEQTMNHLIKKCTVHSFLRGMKDLHVIEGTRSSGCPNYKKRYVILICLTC